MMNYRICSLSDIGQIVSGATPRTTESDNFGGDIAWLTPADLSGHHGKYISHGARNLSEKGYNSCSTQLMPKGTVLFSSRAPIGYVAIAQNPICTNQGFKSIVPYDGIDSEFLYYQLIYLRNEIRELGRGTTFKEISARALGEVQVVVPPLDEQQRVVARIEELFSQLDSAAATLNTIKQQLVVYRQAVVKSILDAYCKDAETVKIGDVCHEVKVGIVIKPTQYYVQNGGVRAFRNANVRRNCIEDTDWAMISHEGHKQNYRSEIHTGDVLIARSGVNLGMAAAVPEKYDGYNAIDIVIAVPKQDIVLPRYLAYYTNSPYGISSVKQNQRGVAQGHLNITVYEKLPLLLPTAEIQKSIIQEIDARLSSCDDIEKTVDTALQQTEALRQSILKKAFEGRL